MFNLLQYGNEQTGNLTITFTKNETLIEFLKLFKKNNSKILDCLKSHDVFLARYDFSDNPIILSYKYINRITIYLFFQIALFLEIIILNKFLSLSLQIPHPRPKKAPRNRHEVHHLRVCLSPGYDRACHHTGANRQSKRYGRLSSTVPVSLLHIWSVSGNAFLWFVCSEFSLNSLGSSALKTVPVLLLHIWSVRGTWKYFFYDLWGSGFITVSMSWQICLQRMPTCYEWFNLYAIYWF